MKTVEYIENKLNRLPGGYVFTYLDFVTDVNKREAVIKTLNRMSAAGRISKLSKGKFYKPETSAFGNLQPGQSQIVKDLLEKDNKVTGYLTGYSIYNSLGLTTQISNIIQIGRNESRPSFKMGRYKVFIVRQKNIITRENIPLFQILDSIRFIKRIPDSSFEFSCGRLLAIIKDLSESRMKTIVRLAQKYPPFTRALLGSMIETAGYASIAEVLKKSLNPVTCYKIPGTGGILPFAKNWNIK